MFQVLARPLSEGTGGHMDNLPMQESEGGVLMAL